MNRPKTAMLLGAALGVLLFVLFILPAEGASRSLAPRVKGVVIARSASILVVDQVMQVAAGESRTARVVVSIRTRVAGRRSAAPAIAVNDLIRADGVHLPDGSLEALHIEVVLTAEEGSFGRPARAGVSGTFWNWILTGGLTIPLR